MTPVPGGRAFGGRRSRAGWDDFECAPRSLCAYSAERLFLFRVCRGLRAAPNAIFTGGVVEGSGICSACFLRKRGAAGEASAWRKRAEPSPSSLRDATSPFCRCATSSPGRGKSFLKGRGLGIAGKLPRELQSPRFRQRLSLWESWRESA